MRRCRPAGWFPDAVDRCARAPAAGRGSAVVWWLALTAAGFVLATALVITLALPATARWEAEERATAGRRVLLPPTVRGGAALR